MPETSLRMSGWLKNRLLPGFYGQKRTAQLLTIIVDLCAHFFLINGPERLLAYGLSRIGTTLATSMPTHTFIGFSPAEILVLADSRLRLTLNYDASAAYTFEITNDDGRWSGYSSTNEVADDGSQQTTTMRDGAGNVSANLNVLVRCP